MTGTKNNERQPLGRLVDALVEDILAASDEDILAEESDSSADIATTVANMKALFEKSILLANKHKMQRAQLGAAARHTSVAPMKWEAAPAREWLRSLGASHPANVSLTLAARNERELSDEDIMGILQDLEELGIPFPGKKIGG